LFYRVRFAHTIKQTHAKNGYAIFGFAHPPPKINESHNELIFVENFIGQILSLQKKVLFLQKFKMTV